LPPLYIIWENIIKLYRKGGNERIGDEKNGKQMKGVLRREREEKLLIKSLRFFATESVILTEFSAK
jgi:hypothetical protein